MSRDSFVGPQPGLASVHYQWEFPGWLPGAGSRFDMRAYIEKALDAGIEAIHVLTQAEPGIYHYPTEIGLEQDPTGRDWLKEVLDEIARHGAQERLKVFAYFTISWDNTAAKHHPEWQQVDEDGQPLWSHDSFGQPLWAYVCTNTPYREYTLRSLREIATNYPGIFGFWLDEPFFASDGCYCRWCDEKFRENHGTALPRGQLSTDDALDLKRFQLDSILDYFAAFEAQVLSERSDLEWTWNGVVAWSLGDWDARLWRASTFNSMEVQEGYLTALIWAKRLQAYARPYEVTLGNDYNWADQRVRPEHELKTFQAITLAHGGGILIGDYPYPDGRMREHEFNWCKDLFRWKSSVQEWVSDVEQVADVALFESLQSNWVRHRQTPVREIPPISPVGRPVGRQWNTPFYRAAGVTAWAKLLAASNVQFDIVNESNVHDFSKYKLVILPDQLSIDDVTARKLEEYVHRGGAILATYRTGLYNALGDIEPSNLWDLFGLAFREFSSFKATFAEVTDKAIKRELPAVPLLVIGPAVLTDVREAHPLGLIRYPIAELSSENRVWFDYNPPEATPTHHPSLAVRSVGAGRVMYLAHPIEQRYLSGTYWALGTLMMACVNELIDEFVVTIDTPGVRAFLCRQRTEDRYVLHFLNEGEWGEATMPDPTSEFWWRSDGYFRNQSLKPWKHPPVKDVSVRVIPGRHVSAVYEVPGMQQLKFRSSEDGLRFTLPTVTTHTVVVVD